MEGGREGGREREKGREGGRGGGGRKENGRGVMGGSKAQMKGGEDTCNLQARHTTYMYMKQSSLACVNRPVHLRLYTV